MKVLEALELLSQLNEDMEVTLIFGKANITSTPTTGPAYAGWPMPSHPMWPSVNQPIMCKSKYEN